MVHVGLSLEGIPFYPKQELSSGYVVPDASVDELEATLRREVDNQIDAAIAADRHGYDYVMTAEHHANLQSSVTPNPVLTQTAVAQATEEVRLVQMANILPWHEPVRLAEQTAMLDVISDGRVEVGVGRGLGSKAAETLGQYWGGSRTDELQNQLAFEETLDVLLAAWTEHFVNYDGEFHQVPPAYTRHENVQEYHYFADDVSEYEPEDYLQMQGETPTLKGLPVVPSPTQDPHPQLWRPGMSADTVAWAAERGMNVCTHCTDFVDVAERVDAYHEAAEAAEWPDHRPDHDGEPFRRGWDADRRRGVATILPICNTDCFDEATRERWREGWKLTLSRSEGAVAEGGSRPDIDVDGHLERYDAPLVGGSEEIRDRIATFAETCGYDDLVVVAHFESLGLRHEDHRDQIRAFAEEVLPYLEEEFPG